MRSRDGTSRCQVMLDSEYGPLETQHPRDKNNYAWGLLEDITWPLPTSSATELSWPPLQPPYAVHISRLRLGLMVGIGGGVPSKRNDIRLGDIVVSQVLTELTIIVLKDKKNSCRFESVMFPFC